MNTHTVTTDDGLRLQVRRFGDPNNKLPVICLHGLTRNAADFDDLALALSAERQVFALDFRGRGRSDYDPEWRHYVPPTYVDDVLAMMRQLLIDEAVFCGTSLGGLVTMLLAGKAPTCVAAAILNDIGPVIEPDGLVRIQQYTGTLPSVQTWDEASAQVKAIYGASLPGMSDADWQSLIKRSFRETESGQPVLDFDPNIGRAVREIDMQLGDPWDAFEHLAGIPTLVLRGELSDILSDATVDAMQQRHEGLARATIADRGHAPLLNEPDSLAAIRRFLGDIE